MDGMVLFVSATNTSRQIASLFIQLRNSYQAPHVSQAKQQKRLNYFWWLVSRIYCCVLENERNRICIVVKHCQPPWLIRSAVFPLNFANFFTPNFSLLHLLLLSVTCWYSDIIHISIDWKGTVAPTTSSNSFKSCINANCITQFYNSQQSIVLLEKASHVFSLRTTMRESALIVQQMSQNLSASFSPHRTSFQPGFHFLKKKDSSSHRNHNLIITFFSQTSRVLRRELNLFIN